jgi:Tfp pilus tip-associated adhesin PilY1
MLAWAVAQSQVKSPLGSYLEINGQVIAPSTSKAINSTFDLEPFDTVRWTTSFNTRIASPFESEGLLTLPPGHSWVAGSVRKPANTTLQWQVNGNWTETEPANGASVTAVKWMLSYKFKGSTSTVNKAVNFSGTGDGYRIIPYSDGLFVVNHHNYGTVLKCRSATDGQTCKGWNANGYALNGSNGAALTQSGPYYTPNLPIEALNYNTGELFVGVDGPSGPTIVCTDLDTITSCGSWVLGGTAGPGNTMGLTSVGDQYFVITSSSTVWCFDINTRNTCGSTNYPGAWFSGAGGTTSVTLGNKLYFANNTGRVFCHDPAIKSTCAGWSNTGLTIGGNGIYPYLEANGTPKGVCTMNSSTCAAINGTTFLSHPNFQSFVTTYGLFPAVFAGYHYHNLSAIIGTKIYGAKTSQAGCYDFATNSMCGTWTIGSLYPYSSIIDPTRPNCLMIIGDDANAAIFDPSTPAGGECKNGIPAKLPDFVFNPIADYFQCDGSRANVTKWGKLRLSPSLPWGGANGLDRVTATLKDGNGNQLPDALRPVRNFATNSYQLDISDIKYADYPVLKIGLELHSPSLLPATAVFGIDLTYEGDPIQVCVATKAPGAPDCQTGATVVLKSRAIDQVGEGFSEEQTATKIMSPGGLTTGCAAFPSSTTARLNNTTLGPRDPRTQIVQGRWSLQYFSGDLWAFNVNQSGQLIGSPFQSAQSSTLVPSQRKIFTAQPTDNVQTKAVTDLNWANLADVQREVLNLDHNGVRDNQGVARLSYLRGTDAGAFRGRNGFTLGPVINSAPVILPNWASESRPEANFPGFSDYRKTLPRAFPLAIYGGNDGALHAYETKGESLSEAWTFVPDVMLRRAAHYSDLNPAEIRSKPYFVDNVPIVGHTNIRSEANPDWRAVAVILYGRGARAITALDVSQTDLKQGSGVLFEYTNTSAPDLKDLGYIISQPDTGAGISSAQLVKLADKRSAVLVGNGIESNDGKSGTPADSGTGTPVLYAFYLDKADAATKYRAWSIGDKNVWSGIETEPEVAFDNGLSTPTPVDIDHNGTIDVVYAGDLKGNLWRFDVSTPSAVKATRLFKTDVNQPITQAPFVSVNTLAKNCGADNAPANAKRCWQVVFSTGAAISPLIGSPNVSTQSIYGILDKGKGRSVELGNLTTINYETNRVINGVEYRALKPTTVNYNNDAVLGWRANLQAFEHGVGAPRVQPTGLVMFSSVRPTTPNQATNICIGPRSWLNELDPLHGYSPIVAFDTNGDGNIDGQDRFDPNSSNPISPTSMAVSGSQFGPPTILRSASTQSQQMSLLLPSLGQDTGQSNSWSGGNSGGGGSPAPGSNSKALTHSNKANLGRMTWREKY